eukprot:c30209_g1_i1 orf=2-325(-)
MHALSLKCQYLEYRNTELEHKVTIQENSITSLEQKTINQEEKIYRLEQTLEKMRANLTPQPQIECKRETNTSMTWASIVNGHATAYTPLDKGKNSEDEIDVNEYKERE